MGWTVDAGAIGFMGWTVDSGAIGSVLWDGLCIMVHRATQQICCLPMCHSYDTKHCCAPLSPGWWLRGWGGAGGAGGAALPVDGVWVKTSQSSSAYSSACMRMMSSGVMPCCSRPLPYLGSCDGRGECEDVSSVCTLRFLAEQATRALGCDSVDRGLNCVGWLDPRCMCAVNEAAA